MRNNMTSFQTITDGDMSSSITSLVSSIKNLDNIGIQAVWSAGSTPVGELFVEVSVDYDQTYEGVVLNAGNWISLPLPVSADVSGNSGSCYLDLNQLSAPWIRLKYVRASGSGTLNSHITGKAI